MSSIKNIINADLSKNWIVKDEEKDEFKTIAKPNFLKRAIMALTGKQVKNDLIEAIERVKTDFSKINEYDDLKKAEEFYLKVSELNLNSNDAQVSKIKAINILGQKIFYKASRIDNPQSEGNISQNNSNISKGLKTAVERNWNSLSQDLKTKFMQCLQQDSIEPLMLNNAGCMVFHDLVKLDSSNLLEQVLNHLQKPANLLVKDEEGNTPLHIALSRDPFRLDGATALLNRIKEANFEELKNNAGDTPWHLLAKYPGLQGDQFKNTLDQFNSILSTAGENNKIIPLLVKNEVGETPLNLAAKHKNMACMSVAFAPFMHKEIFNKSYFNSNNTNESIYNIGLSLDIITDGKGKTPLHYLLENLKGIEGYAEIDRVVSMFYFISTTCPNLLEEERVKNDLIEILKSNNQTDKISPEIEYYLSHPQEMNQIYLGKKKEINEIIRDIRTELETTIDADRAEVINKIIKKYTPDSLKLSDPDPIIKHNMESVREGNNNALHELALENKEKEELRNYITELNAKKQTQANNEGLTPIHIAIEKGNVNFIEVLCDPTNRYGDKLIDRDHQSLFTKNGNLLGFCLANLELAAKQVTDNNAIGENLLKIAGLLLQDQPMLANHPEISDKLSSLENSPYYENLKATIDSAGRSKFEGRLEKSYQAYLFEEIKSVLS